VRRIRTILAACAAALVALASAANASAWTGVFASEGDNHLSRVYFELDSSGHLPQMNLAKVATGACGTVWAQNVKLTIGAPAAVQAAHGWAHFRHWSPLHQIQFDLDLSRHGDRVTVRGTASASTGICTEHLGFEATATVHGLP
jgi:hypothetical protein